ncbi:MAG TPA: HAMP domain-containing sensor histidine kinase, partial [Allocoleopsis sp.]
RAASEDAKKLEKRNTVDRYLQILDTECDREINLINDLLDLQRLEADEPPLNMAPIQLQDWLPQVAIPFQARAVDRQQTFQIDLPANLPVLISDVATLERILAELFNNACKYTPQNGQITVTIQAQSDSMQIRISNTSGEISADDLTYIFDKFYRIPNADPWKQGGTGLGLALVQKLIEHLGGTIAVESLSGQILFTVTLPILGRSR